MFISAHIASDLMLGLHCAGGQIYHGYRWMKGVPEAGKTVEYHQRYFNHYGVTGWNTLAKWGKKSWATTTPMLSPDTQLIVETQNISKHNFAQVNAKAQEVFKGYKQVLPCLSYSASPAAPKGYCLGIVQDFMRTYDAERKGGKEIKAAAISAAKRSERGANLDASVLQFLHDNVCLEWDHSFAKELAKHPKGDGIRSFIRYWYGYDAVGAREVQMQYLLSKDIEGRFPHLALGAYGISTGLYFSKSTTSVADSVYKIHYKQQQPEQTHDAAVESKHRTPRSYGMKDGHAMAIIKGEDQTFIFDPNYGLWKEEDAAAYFKTALPFANDAIVMFKPTF